MTTACIHIYVCCDVVYLLKSPRADTPGRPCAQGICPTSHFAAPFCRTLRAQQMQKNRKRGFERKGREDEDELRVAAYRSACPLRRLGVPDTQPAASADTCCRTAGRWAGRRWSATGSDTAAPANPPACRAGLAIAARPAQPLRTRQRRLIRVSRAQRQLTAKKCQRHVQSRICPSEKSPRIVKNLRPFDTFELRVDVI